MRVRGLISLGEDVGEGDGAVVATVDEDEVDVEEDERENEYGLVRRMGGMIKLKGDVERDLQVPSTATRGW